MELGAAVLGLGDVAALAEALELRGVGAARAVHVARGDLHCPRQPDEERVEVGALAAEIARVEHGLDVAQPAAADLRVAEGVLDDPLVERARLVGIGGDALRDPLRRLQHDAVGGDQLRGLEITREDRAILADHLHRRPRQVDGAIARGEAAGDLDHRSLLAGRPLGVDEADVVLRVLHRARHGGVARPRVTAALEVVGVGQQRDRHPHAGDARGVGDFDLRDGLEAPPRVGFRRWLGGADETRSEAERGGGRRSERGLEKGSTFHEISLGARDAH